jgi:diguanylate cyclase (GGDEF)-like protein
MLKVLVIEDSRFFASILKKGIEDRLGFSMILASSRAEAQAQIASRRGEFFAALVDLHLPDSSEGEVVDDVTAAGIPAIVFTGTFSDELREMVLSKNVVDYVPKNNPSNVDHVLKLLRRLASNAEIRVLVVDDSKISRRHLTRMLEAHRFKVTEAASGAEALAALKAAPDTRIAIVDYHMDGMDGCALSEEIRKSHPRDKFSVIDISAYGGNVLSARFMKAGASDYINKPFIQEELFCRIYQNLELIEQIESLTKIGVSLASARDDALRVNEIDLTANPAYYDLLTALPNRRLFADRVSAALANARRDETRLAVILCDLDLFKRINDSLGHGVGDRVLQQAAARMKDCIREIDTVARLGGDEFALLITGVEGVEAVTRLADRLVEAVRHPFSIDDRPLYVTVSAGIALFPDDGRDVEALTKNAEIAMYRAKETGRNSFQLYTPAMNARSVEFLSLEAALRQALARNEFRLVYQGKVELETGNLTGVEALIRWHHPELGLVSPVDFIPLAESLGLISDIGLWVMEEACRQAVAWRQQGLPPLCVSVNVSARQFRDQDVAAIVADILARTGLEPHLLELELTETLLMQRVDDVAKVLRELRAIGVKISVDDFGTGYSSLSYLSRMPIDALKIDRSFIQSLDNSEDDAEIVSSIIGLAHNLKLSAVAEGVETLEQAIFLKNKGCNQIQGFLVARPMSASDLVTLMDRQLLPVGSAG